MKSFFRKMRPDWSRSSYRTLLFYLLSAIGIVLVVEILCRHSLTQALSFLVSSPAVFFYNALLVLFTLSFSLLARKRGFFFLLICCVWLGLGITDCVILTYRSMPLTASDIWLMSSVRDIFEKYLSHAMLVVIDLGIALVVGTLCFLLLRAKKYRAIYSFALAHILLFGGLLFLLTKLFLSAGILADTTKFSNLPNAYADNGFVYSFSTSLVTRGVGCPKDYSRKRVEGIVEKLPAVQTTETQPNVIFVQLESFFDANYMKELTLEENPVPNFETLKEKYSSGLLSVPAIGAGTANTEFEVLSGMNLTHFGVGEYPYITIVGEKSVETICYAMRDLGYATHVIHNNNATFYDRDVVYRNLGFDTYTPLEYMNDVTFNPRGWAEDAVLTGEILKALRATDGSDFIFTISVQPHGKYPTKPLEDAEVIKIEGMQREGRKNGFEYYLGQLKQTDAFVGALVAAVEAFEEPTVVVFYGDHLPSFNIQPSELSYGDNQTTEYAIYANFPLEREQRDLQSYQLGAYVLERCGIRTGTVLRYHVASGFAADSDEKYQADLKELEYDMLYGESYYNGGAGAPERPEMQFSVSPPSVTRVAQDAEGWYVEGENFTPYCAVMLDGELCETEFVSPECLRFSDEPTSGAELAVAVISAASNGRVLSSTEPYELE